MRNIILLPIGFLLFLITSCSTSQLKQSEFLVGTWKIENKEQYEVWEKNQAGNLEGYSYKMQGDQKKQLETLSIKRQGKALIYEATVPNQNAGQTIPFTLNTDVKDCLSFENEQHDFPKKIQYQKLSDQEILVKVLGEGGQGFSYKIQKR